MRDRDHTGFAGLHVAYARRVAALTGVPWPAALRWWTPASRLAGDGWSACAAAPSATRLAAAYARHSASPSAGPWFGCFSYTVESDRTTVRLHFANRVGSGALAAGHRVERMRELRAALRHALERYPGAVRLRGGSWLYHLPAYRALFPADLLRDATVSDTRDELEFMALWGQFRRGDGTLYTPRVDAFVRAFAVAADEAGLVSAFPLTKLDWSGPLTVVTDWLDASTAG